MDERDLYISTAKAYNKLNISEIEPFLSEDVTYESQGTSVKGRIEVIADLKAKFESLRQANLRLYAELAVITPKRRSGTSDEGIVPCLILSQGVQVNRVAVIIISVTGGAIEKIDVRTSSPHWTETEGSGLFPA